MGNDIGIVCDAPAGLEPERIMTRSEALEFFSLRKANLFESSKEHSLQSKDGVPAENQSYQRLDISDNLKNEVDTFARVDISNLAEPVNVTFKQTYFKAQLGQYLAITGNDEVMGAWDAKAAVVLKTNDQIFPIWQSQQMSLSLSVLQYQFIIFDEDGNLTFQRIG